MPYLTAALAAALLALFRSRVDVAPRGILRYGSRPSYSNANDDDRH